MKTQSPLQTAGGRLACLRHDILDHDCTAWFK